MILEAAAGWVPLLKSGDENAMRPCAATCAGTPTSSRRTWQGGGGGLRRRPGTAVRGRPRRADARVREHRLRRRRRGGPRVLQRARPRARQLQRLIPGKRPADDALLFRDGLPVVVVETAERHGHQQLLLGGKRAPQQAGRMSRLPPRRLATSPLPVTASAARGRPEPRPDLCPPVRRRRPATAQQRRYQASRRRRACRSSCAGIARGPRSAGRASPSGRRARDREAVHQVLDRTPPGRRVARPLEQRPHRMSGMQRELSRRQSPSGRRPASWHAPGLRVRRRDACQGGDCFRVESLGERVEAPSEIVERRAVFELAR